GIYQYYSIYHWKKLVNGYSGFFPPLYLELMKLMPDFPSSNTISILRDLGVPYVVVHLDQYSADSAKSMLERIASEPGVKLQEHFGMDYVIALQPAEISTQKKISYGIGKLEKTTLEL